MRSKILLISEDTIKTNSLVNENLDGKYLQTAIYNAQEIDLCNLLGTALYNKIVSLVADDAIVEDKNANYKYLLDNYITDYLINQVMVSVQAAINYKLTNSGTIQNQDNNKTAIDYQNGKNLMAQFEKYANAYATKLQNYILANISKYPEYTKCENYEHALDPNYCSIYLGNITTGKCDYKYK